MSYTIRIRPPHARHRRGERTHEHMWQICVLQSFGANRFMLIGVIEALTLASAIRRYRLALAKGWTE